MRERERERERGGGGGNMWIILVLEMYLKHPFKQSWLPFLHFPPGVCPRHWPVLPAPGSFALVSPAQTSTCWCSPPAVGRTSGTRGPPLMRQPPRLLLWNSLLMNYKGFIRISLRTKKNYLIFIFYLITFQIRNVSGEKYFQISLTDERSLLYVKISSSEVSISY